MKPELSIIIVSYNTAQYLPACLDSIKAQDINNQLEVIVFDNHSQDETVELVQQKYPEVKVTSSPPQAAGHPCNCKHPPGAGFIPALKSGAFARAIVIPNDKNLGFAKANNQTAKIAQGKYLFFLNPDTKLQEHCLVTLLAEAKKQASEDFILIPRQISYDGTEFICQGLAVDFFGYPNTAHSKGGSQLLRPVFYADGAALLLPKTTFTKLGMFDEDHFLYHEDIDLSWKAHLMKIPLIPVPEAKVHHHVGAVAGGGSEKGKSYTTSYLRRLHVEKNLLTNLLKNYSPLTLTWILPLHFLLNLLEFLLFLLLLQPHTAVVYPLSYWENLKNITPILKKRRWIQKQRLASDREILAKMVKIPSKFFLLARAGIPKIKG